MLVGRGYKDAKDGDYIFSDIPLFFPLLPILEVCISSKIRQHYPNQKMGRGKWLGYVERN